MLVSLMPTTAALAQFTGPSASVRSVTVAEAKTLRVGTYVSMTGNVVNHQRSEYFTFRDETGEMRVEIPRRVWRGRQVGPSDPVRIFGEIDRGFSGRYIDVKILEVLAEADPPGN